MTQQYICCFNELSKRYYTSKLHLKRYGLWFIVDIAFLMAGKWGVQCKCYVRKGDKIALLWINTLICVG